MGASLWNFRASVERDFHRVEHLATAMGVLVHPNYSDELANGVAVSYYPYSSKFDRYYINTQLGEDLVTNPQVHSKPEELVVSGDGTYQVLSTSNLVELGNLLMSDAQLLQLRQHLHVIHDHFEQFYDPAAGDPFAMEIEFKITSDNILAIKQARPWVFGVEAAVTPIVVNEPPVVTGRDAFTYRENGASSLYTFRATDPEQSTITWSVSGDDGDDFSIDGGGVLTFATPPDYEAPADMGGNNVYETTVVATDNQGSSGTFDVTITVTDVNEGPEITLVDNAQGSVPENQDVNTVLATYSGGDPEMPGEAITRWSNSGTDGSDFTINESGELRFRNTPDYERPADANRDNVYNLSVRASDGRYYGYLEVTVAVTNLNEAPTIATISRTEFSQRENTTSILYTYRATDQDRSDAIRWSVEGEDGDDFAIYNGMLTFRLLPDYAGPADSNRDTQYQVRWWPLTSAACATPLMPRSPSPR